MNREALWNRIYEASENPLPEIIRWKKSAGGKVFGCLSCMPYFVPEEIIHSSGALPVGIWGGEIPISQADGRLQTFACSMVRSSLEMGLKGMFSICDALVFPSTCDAFQNISEVWKRSSAPSPPCIEIVMPRQIARSSAHGFMEASLRRFRSEVEQVTGMTVSDEALASSIRTYNEDRRLLCELDALRSEDPYLISATDMMALVRTSAFMPKQEHVSLLRSLREALRTSTAERDRRNAIRLFLAGVMPRPAEILRILEHAGARVVGDRLGMGSLHYSLTISENHDPVRALAEGYMRYPPCSTIYKDTGDRAVDLIEQVKGTRAEAVVIMGMKFCEPEFFDYPDLKERLERSGIPTLVLETELGMSAYGPVKTRIEAFFETLRSGSGG